MKTLQNTLQQDVVSELQWDPMLDSSRIGVSVDDGVVALTGHVRNLVERVAAEAAVKRVRGVTAIANELAVDLFPKDARDDVEIAKAARDALRWNAVVPGERIELTVSKGWVTLEGQVARAHQRAAAERAVQSLLGVIGVTNRITLEPQVSPADLRRKLNDALHRYARLEVAGIRAEVAGHKVTLLGRVHSWQERDMAQEAAWSAPGVTQVDNLLEVV